MSRKSGERPTRASRLGSWGCQLRSVVPGPARPAVPPGPLATIIYTTKSNFCRPSSATLCVAHPSGERYTSKL